MADGRRLTPHMKLHPDVQALSDALHQLEDFLRVHDQTHWADAIAGCVRAVDQSDARGLRSFLALFGGMGSLDDLVLSPEKVVLVSENDRLKNLTAKAWGIASALARDLP